MRFSREVIRFSNPPILSAIRFSAPEDFSSIRLIRFPIPSSLDSILSNFLYTSSNFLSMRVIIQKNPPSIGRVTCRKIFQSILCLLFSAYCKSNILYLKEHFKHYFLDMKEHQIYFGKKFSQRKDGYWICTTDSGLYAHRWVWMIHFGEVAPGMDIHHRDDNPANNEISNLLMLTPSQHLKFHWRIRKHDRNQLLLAI